MCERLKNNIPRLRQELLRAGLVETEVTNYFVSEEGEIFSIANGSIKKRKCVIDKSGYYRVKLGSKRTLFVHRLVARAFCSGETEERCEVNHKNGDKLNNHKNNLEWVTHRENIKHLIEILRKGRGVTRGGNKTGHVGVYKRKHGYIFLISIRRRITKSELFNTALEASIARQAVEDASWDESKVYDSDREVA